MRNGDVLTFLLNTGSNKNYIRQDIVKNPKDNNQIFYAKSANSAIRISQHTLLTFSGIDDAPLKCYLLPGFVSFDAILGNDSFKELSAVIYMTENYFTLGNGLGINIKQRIAQSVNNKELRTQDLSESQKLSFRNIVKRHGQLFAELDEKLTYSTVVVPDIKTENRAPIYARSYPYPMALKDVLEEEINRLLRDGIIRPSRSPYNSPIWVVPKKDDHLGKRKYRLVVEIECGDDCGQISNPRY